MACWFSRVRRHNFHQQILDVLRRLFISSECARLVQPFGLLPGGSAWRSPISSSSQSRWSARIFSPLMKFNPLCNRLAGERLVFARGQIQNLPHTAAEMRAVGAPRGCFSGKWKDSLGDDLRRARWSPANFRKRLVGQFGLALPADEAGPPARHPRRLEIRRGVRAHGGFSRAISS